MDAVTVQGLRHQVSVSARDRAYDSLREAIIDCELLPGERLSENELAARLGVSRTPVREALIRLGEEQLVFVVPQRGTFVAPISLEGVSDAQFVREALECAAVREAARGEDPERLVPLRRLLHDQELLVRDGDVAGFDHLDEELHAEIAGLSGHLIAVSLIRRARGHLDRIRRLSLRTQPYLDEMLFEHSEIVAAIEDGDADAAELAMREHVRMVVSELPRIRSERPELFVEQV